MRLRYSKNPWPHTVWTNGTRTWTTPGAGLACAGPEKTISISRPLCELNSDDEVRDTVLHEIVHALAWKRHGENCGHDARWKKICVEVGARPVACYDGNDVTQPDAPWVLAHKETGEVFRSYFKRSNRNWSKIWIRGRKADTFCINHSNKLW